MKGAQKNRAIQLNGRLQDVGFDVKWPRRNTLRPHVGAETMKHWALKAAICRRISELNDIFYTEVDSNRGVPDILRLHTEDEKAYVYEVETGLTSDKRREKAARYTDNATCSVVADCYVLDPLDAPDSVLELKHWVEERVV